VELSVEKQENAIFTFDKQARFQWVAFWPCTPGPNLEIAPGTGIDKQWGSCLGCFRRRSKGLAK
jgi:hypothetical protein